MDNLSSCIKITPEALRDLVLRLASQQTRNNRNSVSVSTIIRCLTEGCDLGSGELRSKRYELILDAIRQAADHAQGMRFVPSLG